MLCSGQPAGIFESTLGIYRYDSLVHLCLEFTATSTVANNQACARRECQGVCSKKVEDFEDVRHPLL